MLHPYGSYKCWGLIPIANFDIKRKPFVIVRDEYGVFVIDLDLRKIGELEELKQIKIGKNLFGHGSILRVANNEVWTVRIS